MKQINRIDKVEVYIVKLPLVKPFATSFSVETQKEALLLKISSEEVSGWGECVSSPNPYYSSETNSTAYYIIKDFLVPALMNMRDFSVEEVLRTFDRIRGHNMAKATVENALIDLLAKKSEIPIFKLIGGNYKRIMSGISIGIKKNTDELLESIQGAIKKRYHRIKIKIKRGKDIKILKAVRKAFPKIMVMVDANADYSIEDLDILCEFDKYDLMMIEQPLAYNDIYMHSFVQKKIKTPICLDESIKNLIDVKAAISLKSCRIINIKQGRVGGIINSKTIQSYCKDNNIKVWSGGMLETGIGRALNIHLQTLPGFVLPGDTSETARYFSEDIVSEPVVLEPDGFIKIPEGAGIGVKVVQKKLDRFKTFHVNIRL